MTSFLRKVMPLVTILLLLALATSVFAADLTGRLRGIVTDPSGAVVANAKVMLTNPSTGVAKTVTTNSTGEYLFDALPATYQLKVSTEGFRTALFETVEINLNEVRSLNVKLSVGQAAQTVTVTEQAVSVVPQETQIRGIVDGTRATELPLNGRDFSDLVYLQPGVVTSVGTGQGTFSVSGARPTTNNFQLDGGDLNDPEVPNNASQMFTSGIPVDAIDEFSVITSNGNAEFGRSTGGTINVITKSGTNSFHGKAWEFLRNDALDARDYFSGWNTDTNTAPKKNPLKLNQFGGQMGGPIQQNKTFFFSSWESYRLRQQSPSVTWVPDPALLSNNLTNPFLKAVLLNGYPKPSEVYGDGTGIVNGTTDAGGNQDSLFAKVNRTINQNQQGFASFQYTNSTCASCQGGSAVPGTAIGIAYKNFHAVLNHDWTLRPTLLNTFRFVFQRNQMGFPTAKQSQALLDTGKLRTAGPYAGLPFTNDDGPNGFPTISWAQGNFNSLGVSSGMPQGRATSEFQYEDTLSWTKGRHQLKFGAQVMRILENSTFSSAIRPAISLYDYNIFNEASGVAVPYEIYSQTQYFYNWHGNSERGFRLLETGFFAQDSFRVNSRLTVDLGLRYELSTVPSEVQGALSNAFVMNNGKPEACKSLPYGSGMANVAIVPTAQFGIGPYCSDRNNFAPRFGFAWDMFGDGKTMLRGSYGIFYDRLFGNVYGNLRFSAPYVTATSLTSQPFNGIQASPTLSPTAVLSATTLDPGLRTPYLQRWTLSGSRQVIDSNSVLTVSYVGSKGTKLLRNDYPNLNSTFASQFRPSNAGNYSTMTTVGRNATDMSNNVIWGPFSSITNRVSDVNSNYNSLQAEFNHRFSHGFTLQASYTWSHSLDEMSDDVAGYLDSSTPPAPYKNTLAPLWASCIGGTPSASAGNLTKLVNCAAGTTFPITAAGYDQAAAYMWQHGLVVPGNVQDNYGDSTFDMRHRISINAVYELPIGKNKAFLGGVSGLVDKFVSGWQMGGISTYQSGFPVPLFSGVDANLDGAAQDRPTLIGNLASLYSNGGSPKVDPNDPQTVTLMNAWAGILSQGVGVVNPTARVGRGFIKSPKYFNLDFTTSKRTKISERLDMQFRVDFFNVLNHTNFSFPNATLTSAHFGEITDVAHSPRQIQFGMKFEF